MDNGLTEYGHESTKAELEQAATNLHAYLVAWVGRDWRRACSIGSKELRKTLEDVSAFAEETRGWGCARMLASVASGEPPLAVTPYEATEIDAESLRMRRNGGFIFFYLHGEARQQDVHRDDGVWRVKAPLPSSPH